MFTEEQTEVLLHAEERDLQGVLEAIILLEALIGTTTAVQQEVRDLQEVQDQ